MEWDDIAEHAHQSVADNWFLRYHEQRAHIADWVSTFRDGRACELVGVCCGSFNWGCRILFEDTTEWLVRFAVPGMVMDGDAKLRREIAAMTMIAQRTTIPVPKVHAWGLSEQNSLGLGPFIVMDYVHGESLGHLWRTSDTDRVLRTDIDEEDLRKVYRQIAGFYLELSDLKFPVSGSLSIGDDQSIQADLCPLTLKMQEIEAHSGVKVGGDRPSTFPSATEYFVHVAEQDMEHLLQQPNSVNDEDDARAKYKFRRHFDAILPRFIAEEYDRTEFRLICDDFRYGNMIVNNSTELKIVAVLDWEWTYAAPYQLFVSPPRWLLIQKPIEWEEPFGPQFDRYQVCLDLFLQELEHEESKRAKAQHEEERLSALMRKTLRTGKFWFHELIYDCFTPVDNPALRAICDAYPEVRELAPSEHPGLDAFVKEKMRQLAAYTEQWKAIEESEGQDKI